MSLSGLIDGLAHVFYLSPQSETDKIEFYNNINRYFQINVL